MNGFILQAFRRDRKRVVFFDLTTKREPVVVRSPKQAPKVAPKAPRPAPVPRCRTTKQMAQAPKGSVFIMRKRYVKRGWYRARMICRGDLRIRSSETLTNPAIWDFQYPAIILDHAVALTPEQVEAYAALCERARPFPVEPPPVTLAPHA